MALTYRTPMEDIVISFEPQVQSLIANSAAELYKNLENENCKYFNYYLPAVAKKKLSAAGIYLSPYSAVVHSHPVCKTLENYMLYSVLPNYLDGKYFFVGIKNKKINLLKSRNKKLESVICINRLVTSADRLRYSNDFVTFESVSHEDLRRHGPGLSEPALQGIIEPLKRRKATHLFLHDELHYWGSDDLCNFLQVVRPETLLATIVYPPELLFRQNRSLNEWCYTYEVRGQNLFFFPDGVRSEGYEQPLNGGYLLGCNKVVLKDGSVYMVDVLCSKFAHHLVAITRGAAVTSMHRSFGPFEACSSDSLAKLCPDYPVCFPVPFDVVNKIYRYLRTLKKPDVQSAIAKLSQIVSEPSGREIDFIEDFSKLVIKNESFNITIVPERLRQFVGTWLGRLPSALASKLEQVQSLCLSEFIKSLKPHNFTIKLEALKYNHLWNDVRLWVSEEGLEDYSIEGMDAKFTTGSHVPPRVASPYQGLAHFCDRAWKPLLLVDKKILSSVLKRLAVQRFRGEHRRRISTAELESFVNSLLERAKLIQKQNRKGSLRESIAAHHYLNYDSIRDAARAIASLCMRWVRALFSELGPRWFLRLNRSNMMWLPAPSDAILLSREAEKNWAEVVRSICTPLGKSSHSWGQLTRMAPAEGRPRATDTSCMLPVAASVGLAELSRAGTLSCSCGVAMGISPIAVAEHPFVARDTLKGRKAGWYSMGGVPYTYNGGSHKSQGWDSLLQMWCEANAIDPKYDSCLYQIYTEGAALGYHADDEDLFEQGESILTLNLSGAAEFGVKCKNGRGSVHLGGPQQFEMPAGFQITHKHSVWGCSKQRESVTFRCLRKSRAIAQSVPASVAPELLYEHAVEAQQVSVEKPERNADVVAYKLGSVDVNVCEALWETVSYAALDVPGDGSCFWHSVGRLLGLNSLELKRRCVGYRFHAEGLDAELDKAAQDGAYADDTCVAATVAVINVQIRIWNKDVDKLFTFSTADVDKVIDLQLEGEHYMPMLIRNNCVVRAIADGLNRLECEVQHVLERKCAPVLLEDLRKGRGLEPMNLELVFSCFGVCALVDVGGRTVVYNEAGGTHMQFTLHNEHLSYNPRKKKPSLDLVAGAKHGKLFAASVIESLQAMGTMIARKPDITSAGLLADSFFDASTGVLRSSLFNDQSNLRKAFVKNAGEESKPICTILGTFGSGKSYIFKKLLSGGAGRAFDYVSPRRALADEFKRSVGLVKKKGSQKVGQENWKVSTFETFLDRASHLLEGQVVVLDEVQLYPPGYIDLILCLLHVPVHLFLIGDPVQSDYDNERDRAVLSCLAECCTALLRGETYKYNMRSKRFCNRNFIGRLPCTILESDCTTEEPHVMRAHIDNLADLEPAYTEVILVSSFDEKIVAQSYQSKARVLTFGESTGLTFDYGTILITSVAERVNEKRWVTALSRFRMNLCFVNCTSMSYEQLAVRYKGRFLCKFLCRGARTEDLQQLLPGKPQFTEEYSKTIGKDEGVREAKVAGDPWLKTMVNLLQAPDLQEEEIAEMALPEEWFRTHLPREELEGVRSRWVHKILAKEAREVRLGDIVSEQFTDDHSKQIGGRQLTNAAERFETIYPRHRANDTVTFIMAVRKRLSFSNPARERAKLHDACVYGRALLDVFRKHVPLRPEHNHKFMEAALWNFEEKKLSKSAATIENHSGRSCRDWPIDMAQIFSKSQLCTKFDNRFRLAKAAQSIVCFQHAVLCRFAPFMRYIEMKVHEVLPARFYIHSGKGLDELNSWVKGGKFDGVCTESDYEAFDASQDEFIMAFELELMKFLRLPHDMIEDYKFIKTSLGSKLGNFAIMRFSGEASTFLFNTLANMLFTFMKYEIKGDEYICFAGDDMCASRELKVVGKYKKFLDKLKLKAKVQMTQKPTFCGWHLCPDGIYKKPQLVFERMCIALELNNLANCIDNYAIEVAFAYRLGERAVNRMDEEEVGAFYNCVRLIVRNKHLLKSDVRAVFEESPVS
nr:replicase [Hop latent virus]